MSVRPAPEFFADLDDGLPARRGEDQTSKIIRLAKEAAAATPTVRQLPRMIALHWELEALFRKHINLDDAISDAIGEASSVVCKSIAQAPVSCLNDIADKFRFAASLIEEEGGMLYAEPETVIAAVTDLLAWRNGEEATGRCSFYAALSVS